MKWFLMIFAFSVCVFAQDAQPVAQAPVVAAQTAAVAALQGVDSKIPAAIPAWILAVVGGVAEVGLRVYPTAKPKSLLLAISAGLALLGSIFGKLSGLADMLVQNVKDPEQK